MFGFSSHFFRSSQHWWDAHLLSAWSLNWWYHYCNSTLSKYLGNHLWYQLWCHFWHSFGSNTRWFFSYGISKNFGSRWNSVSGCRTWEILDFPISQLIYVSMLALPLSFWNFICNWVFGCNHYTWYPLVTSRIIFDIYQIPCMKFSCHFTFVFPLWKKKKNLLGINDSKGFLFWASSTSLLGLMLQLSEVLYKVLIQVT